MTARRDRVVRVGPGATPNPPGTSGAGATASTLELPSERSFAGGSPTAAIVHLRVAIPKHQPRGAVDEFSGVTVPDLLMELGLCRGWLSVLLFLYGAGSASPWHMRNRIPAGQESIGHALRTLARLGMLEYTKSEVFPFATSYRLSERGRRLAETPIVKWSTVGLE